MQERAMSNALMQTIAQAAHDIANPGPVRWCKRCSRKHPSRRPCDLARVAVEASTGRMVERLIHPSARNDT